MRLRIIIYKKKMSALTVREFNNTRLAASSWLFDLNFSVSLVKADMDIKKTKKENFLSK